MADATYTGDAAVQDGATFTASTSVADPVGGVFNDAIASISSGSSGAVRLTASRAFHVNLRDAAGAAITTTAAAMADATSNPTVGGLGTFVMVYNGSTWDRHRSVTNGQDTTGTGIASAGILGQLDDVSTGTVTENQFAPVRISSRRALLIEGVASGTNVNVNLAASAATVTVDTELAAAAAQSDAAANPTVPVVGSFQSAFNGTTWDRVRTVESVSAAPNVSTGVLAAGLGPGFDRKLNPSNLGTATNSAITNTVDGADIYTYYIGTSTTGTYTFEVTADDTNWVAALWANAKTGAISSGNLTPTTGDVWAVSVTGWRQVRVRTVSTLGATMAVKTTATVAGNQPSTFRSLTNARSADVSIVDGSGSQITSFTNTQYVGDAAITATPTGMVAMGLANSAAPTDVSANNDAVAMWMLRNGSAVVNLASGGTLIAAAALADGASNPTAFTFGSGTLVFNGTTWDRARGAATLADALANPGTGLAQGQNFLMGYNGTTWDRLRTVGTGILKADISTIAGTVPGATSFLPARLTDGTAYYTKTGQTAATAAFAQLSDQTNTVSVIAATNALKSDLSSIAGTATVTAGVSGMLAVGGNVASDIPITANPLTVGARASTALPSAVSADGDAVNLWATRNGVLITARADSAGTLEGVYAAPSDAQSNAQTMGNVNNFPQVYNGTTWDRMRSVEALSTAPNVTTGILAVGTGPGFDRKLNPSNLGTAVNSAITNTVDGADVYQYFIGTSTTGTYTFEVTADDSTWTAATWANAKTGAISSGNLTPTSGDVYAVNVSGWRQVRVRTVTTLGATMAVKTTATRAGQASATVRGLTNARGLDVSIVDGSGNQVTSFGGGTQYVGDAAATSTPTGTVAMGLANAAAPTDVSANNDAVAQWMLRNGSTVVNLASGGTLITFPASAALSDVLTNPTVTGIGAYAIGWDGTNWGRIRINLPNADGVSSGSSGILDSMNRNYIYNGSTWDRLRTASTDGMSGTGIAGAGSLVWNGTTWDRVRSTTIGDSVTTGAMAAGMYAWNGSAMDRLRTTAGQQATTGPTPLGVLAVGTGPGFQVKDSPTGVAATSTANAVTVVVNGADVIAFHVTTIGTTPGSMIFETTNDDSSWATAGFVIKQSTGPDLRVEGAFVPAVNDVYLVRVTGMRQVRYRVNAVYASGTATVKVTSAMGVGMIKGIDLAAPPHNIGYAITSATAQYTTTQTSVTLGPTVSSTQRMVVTSIQIQAGGTTAGELQVYFGTGAYSRGTSKAIFDGEFAPSSTNKPGVIITPSTPFMGAADEELKVTDSAAINKLTITVWYYIVTA